MFLLARNCGCSGFCEQVHCRGETAAISPYYHSAVLAPFFAQTFCMPKSLFFFMSSGLATIQIVDKQSPHTNCFAFSTMTLVLLVEGLPLLKSFFTSSRPFLNFLCKSKYTCWSFSSVCDGVFLNQTKNYRFIRCVVFIILLSVLIAEHEKKIHIYIYIYIYIYI